MHKNKASLNQICGKNAQKLKHVTNAGLESVWKVEE